MTTQWNDELKQQVIKMYTDAEPTPETSTEIIKDIAEEIEASPNGVRMVLVQAQVYVKKDPGTSSSGKSTKTSSNEGSKRVNKESAINDLKAAISDIGAEVNDEILSKLTGKAAIYLTQVLKHK